MEIDFFNNRSNSTQRQILRACNPSYKPETQAYTVYQNKTQFLVVWGLLATTYCTPQLEMEDLKLGQRPDVCVEIIMIC